MSTLQICFMLLLCSFAVVRILLLKRCHFPHAEKAVGTLTGVWMLAAAAVTAPLFYPLLQSGLEAGAQNPLILILALAKGFTLWGVLYLRQIMMRRSASVTAFVGPLILALVAVGNFFMGEVLTNSQWLGVVLLALLGSLFTVKGHLRHLERAYVWLFGAIIVTSVIPALCDQAVISQSNWYTMLVFSGSAMVLCGLAFGDRQIWRAIFTNKNALRAGIFWGATEVVILYSFITILPVTVGVMALQSSTPILMLISALVWKEGNPLQQTAFGTAGLACALLLLI